MCKSITCIILGVFNVALLIGGLALLILGALMRWNKQVLKSMCDFAVQFIQKHLGEQGAKSAELALERIQEFAGPFALIVFIGGIVIVCVAALAFIGLCCNIKLFMIIYAVIVGLLFVAHVIVLIIYFANKGLILGIAHKYLREAVYGYESMDSGNIESAVMTIIMPTLGCCGYESANDFNDPGAKFTKTDKLDNVTYTNLTYPIPCCNLRLELKDEPGYCPHTFAPNNSYIEYGCKAKMEKDFFDKIALGSIVILAVTGIVLAMTIIYIKC